MGASNLKLIHISSTLDCTTFHIYNLKKIFKSWQVCDWLAKWLIGIFESKVAEGLSVVLYIFVAHLA